MVNNLNSIKVMLKHLFKVALIIADFAATLVTNFLLILPALLKVASSRQIVILTEGGFGHTVMAPDIARRVFPKQKTLIIIFSVKGRHNWYLAKLWVDVDVIHLWKFLNFYSRFQSVFIPLFVLWVLRLILRKRVFMVTKDSDWKVGSRYEAWIEPMSLYQTFVTQQIIRFGPLIQPRNSANEFLLYWVREVFLNPLPQPALPLAIDKRFMKRLEEIQPKRSGLLAVYLRRKGENGDGLTRCGGNYEEYRPIFEMARKRGLVVLVLGDRPLEECPSDLRKYLMDARSFNLDSECYNLAAVLKCDYFVGDPGGGSLLPCLMQIPKLMVNAFPFSQAWPGYLLLFKNVIDPKGKRLSLAECFNNYPWTYDFDAGYLLQNNTIYEIAAAMDEMFQIFKPDWATYIAKSNFKTMGSYSREGARLCEVQYMTNY